MNAILSVLDDAMALGKLTEDYKIFGRSDFGGPGPGDAFMKIIKDWCRYGNRTIDCLLSTTLHFESTTDRSEETTATFEDTTSFEETTSELITGGSTTDVLRIPNPITRDEWEAQPPRSTNISKLDLPIKRIIIGHTGGEFCTNQVSKKIKFLKYISNTN